VLLDFVFLSHEQLQTISFISNHYITPIHHALQLYFPRNLLGKIQKTTFLKIQPQEYQYRNENAFNLSEKQEKIFQTIQNKEKNNKFLIYGVTGSGKTEIYMRLIAENLKK